MIPQEADQTHIEYGFPVVRSTFSFETVLFISLLAVNVITSMLERPNRNLANDYLDIDQPLRNTPVRLLPNISTSLDIQLLIF